MNVWQAVHTYLKFWDIFNKNFQKITKWRKAKNILFGWAPAKASKRTQEMKTISPPVDHALW